MLLNSLKEGNFSFKQKDYSIELSVQRIENGWQISGRVAGRPGLVELLAIPIKDVLLLNNWQSWGPCRVVRKGQPINVQLSDDWKYSASMFPELLEKKLVSDYFFATENLVAGFLSSRIGHGFFAIEGDHAVAMIEYFDRIFDEPTELEPLLIFEGEDVSVSLEHYAEAVNVHNRVEFQPFETVGWCSWYHYFLDLSWDELLKNARLADKFGITVFQIDDGYERDIGDWTITREGFPKLEEMIRTLKEQGLRVGLWLAPFSASETSQIFMEHPQWLVTENGEPKMAYRNWNKKIYALDLTKEEVKRWLHDLFYGLKKLGVDYFKIDFLFAGAIPGERTEHRTPVEALREGLKTIRDATHGSFVLGCGCPLLPAVGLVDGMRIGPDTAPYWGDDKPDMGFPAAKWALRNAITRYFMHKRFWMNDPDCLLLRGQQTQLDSQEKRLYAYVCGMLDNMIILSDDLTLLDEESESILRHTLSLRGGRAKVENILSTDLTYIITSKGMRLFVDLNSKKFSFEKF